MTPENQKAVVDEAKSWLGTPYHHAAGIKGVGVDCAYLLIEVFAKCGLVERFTPARYPMDWHFHKGDELYLGNVLKYAHEVDIPEPGDIALYKFGRCISHGAIIVDWPRVIHAVRNQGCVVANGTASGLGPRLAGFWRLSERN